MQKITLPPGQWTEIWQRSLFQVVGQKSIRIAIGSYPPGVDQLPSRLIPPGLNAPYFKTQDYDPKIFNLEDFMFGNVAALYFMPDGNDPVDVVLL